MKHVIEKDLNNFNLLISVYTVVLNLDSLLQIN